MTIKTVAYISTFPPQYCGIGTYTENLARSVAPSWSVSVLSEIGTVPPKKIPHIPVFPTWRRQNFFQDLQTAFQQKVPDVIHFQHEFGLFPDTQAFNKLVFELSKRTKVVTTLHTVLGSNDRRNPSINNVIVHTLACKQMLFSQTADIACYPTNVTVIPHGIHYAPLKDQYFNKNIFYRPADFVTLGFIAESKGYEEILEALQLLLKRTREWAYRIVGMPHDHIYLMKLQNKILQFGLERNVIVECGYSTSEFPGAIMILGNKDGNTYSASGQLANCIGKNFITYAKSAPIYEHLPGIHYWRDSNELADLLYSFVIQKTGFNYIEEPCLPCAIPSRSWEDVAKLHTQVYNKLG